MPMNIANEQGGVKVWCTSAKQYTTVVDGGCRVCGSTKHTIREVSTNMATTTVLDSALLAEAIEVLERIGCQFDFCDGPTLEPVDMVTCFACGTLAKLRVTAGRPPRRNDEMTFEEAQQARDDAYMARATHRTVAEIVSTRKAYQS